MMDKSRYPFTTIGDTGAAFDGGDIALDEDEGCGPAPEAIRVIRLSPEAV
jgi:hypothetical protein